MGSGARVEGRISAVSGRIALDAAQAGAVSNVNGGITVGNGSVVYGELRVERSGRMRRGRPPVIIIGARSRVAGPLVFEQEVELYVHETAEIGRVDGATPVRFSGDRP